MSNLTATTREAWDRTTLHEVYMRTILIRKLIDLNQVLPAGIAVKHTVDFAEMDDLAQEYGPEEPLDGGKKTVAETALWYPKDLQVPVEIRGKDWRNNSRGKGDGRVIPLPQFLVEKGQRAMRLKLNSILYRTGSAARDASSDSNAGWQGVLDALTHSIKYGGLLRTDATTRYWWQSASLGNVWTDQATEIAPNIANFRKCIDAVNHFQKDTTKMLAITSNEIYRNLQAEVDGRRQYRPGPMAEHGFTSMMIDNVEVVAEEYFSNPSNSDRSTMAKYFFMLDLSSWRMHLDPERKMGTLTEFVWQGKQLGGKDLYLARVMLSGLISCLYPNRNLFLSNMTF